MQVRIDPPPSNPARLSAEQQRRLDRIIAAMKNKVPTAAENPGRISSQEAQMIDQISINGEPLPPEEQPKKKRGGRKPRLNGSGAAPSVPENGGNVYLTPEQLSRLWRAVTGGNIFLSGVTHNITIGVSLDSFKKALPVLLEKL
jgi:hypothetical protein